MVGLLFITAIAGLGLTLGEDFGPSDEASVTSQKNATVFYVNPVLFAVSWVNIASFSEANFV